MQQYFDCTVVLKRDKAIFQWSRSERSLGAIGKNITSVVKRTCDEDARDMVDEIDHKEHQFVNGVCILK